MIRVICSYLVALLVGLSLIPLNIRLVKKLNASQPILLYVDNHKAKSGTPTMGGCSIVLALLTALAFISHENREAYIVLIVVVGYALIGFIDDFIKVRYKNNKGLSPLQKISFQVVLAVIVSVYAYYQNDIGGSVFVPFMPKTVELGRFAPVYYTFIFLAFTNSVNLTDGLDGLATSVTVANAFFICLIMGIALLSGVISGTLATDVVILCAALGGSLCAFLFFNGYPAKIFMGDTGSLALGGFLACIAVFSRMSLNMLLIGITYILSSLSVIIQVIAFKTTGKRVFLMSPLHHHFERKGIHESKITLIYTLITIVSGIVTTALTIIFYGQFA